MKRQAVHSPKLPNPPPQTWSTAIRVGEVLYVSGTTARGTDGETVHGEGEYEQSKVIFTKIRHVIEGAGGAMNDVTKMTIFVTDIEQNTEVWRARKEFFSGDFPASSLVEVSALAKPEILVEIEVIAHIGSSRPA
jgi:2-iminobutanoate/2-iminopropanoate deaminase